jgi:ribosome-binding factor A
MTERMRRVNESVRAVVAEAIVGLKDPRLGVTTVTGVVVSPDLKDGKVYISVFGSTKKQAKTMRALEAARGHVQGVLARELSMKRTPHLTFEYDQTVEEGVRLTKLIDELAPDTPFDDESGDSPAD